jgi:hypothetical protein
MNALINKTMTALALVLSLSLALGTAINAREADMDRLANSEITSEFDLDNCSYDIEKDLWRCKL